MHAPRLSRPSIASLLLAASLCVTSLAHAAPPFPPIALPTGTQRIEPAPADSIAADEKLYRQHISYLASPFMEGRAPGTKGNRIAADYIEWQYTRLGFKPAFPTDSKDAEGKETSTPFTSYRQVFKAPPSQRPEDKLKLIEQSATYSKGDDQITLAPGKDFNVIGYSAAGDVTGPIVFAGYSIDDEDGDYHSYPVKADLTGKIVMIFRFEPMNEHGKSLWAEEGQSWSRAAGLEPKFREAVYNKAAGVILVNPPGADDPRADKLEDIKFGNNQQKIPVIMLSREAADTLVRAADTQGRSLMDLRKLADKEGGTIDFKSDVELTIKSKIEKPVLMTDNVGAILPGKGKLADEYVVIGSHYDHVGYGYFGSRSNAAGVIHPGADDNASGSSGNLLVAEKLAKEYAALPEGSDARSILFLAFSAEESGLVGSRYYTKHMIAPTSAHAIMLNMDMIGRLRPEVKGNLEVGGVGTADGFEEWATPYWDHSGFNIKTVPVGMPNSDHAEFYKSKIPAVYVFTGLHKEYHTPADTIDTINTNGAAQVADLVFRIAMDAAQRHEPFVFNAGVNNKPKTSDGADAEKTEKSAAKKSADPHAAAADNGDDDQPAQRPGRRVRFGIAPGNYGDDKPGIEVAQLSSPDLPAAKAGIKEGDRLMKWNDVELTDVMALQVCMEKAKPGDVVKITYQRDGKEHVVDVTLVGGSASPVPK